MYLEYFDLQEPPFRITPDTKFIFFTPQYEAASDSLLYAIQQRLGFMVVTGDTGTGKTTLSRHMLSQIDPNSIETALLVNPLISVPELLQAINKDFGIATRVLSPQSQIQALNKHLLKLHEQGKTALVIIDESQDLTEEALEMIRLLTNIETETAKLLQIMLIGQTELDKKLAKHELRQLRQRIAVHVTLEPLAFNETVRYISHRILIAGGKGKVHFEPSTYRVIYQITQGYPRLINLLCDRALTAAYTADTPFITKEIVRRAQADLRMTQMVPPLWQFWKRAGSLFGR